MTLASIEIMILAAAINFCSVSSINSCCSPIGYIFSVVSFIISGVIVSLIYMSCMFNRPDHEDRD
jgi:NADH:ubiquinone oxidoreductase subunit K